MAMIRYYGDIIRVGRYRVFGLVRTYQVRPHYAADGSVKDIAGAAHRLLWAQEGWIPTLLVFFLGGFSGHSSCDSRLDGTAVFALLATES